MSLRISFRPATVLRTPWLVAFAMSAKLPVSVATAEKAAPNRPARAASIRPLIATILANSAISFTPSRLLDAASSSSSTSRRLWAAAAEKSFRSRNLSKRFPMTSRVVAINSSPLASSCSPLIRASVLLTNSLVFVTTFIRLEQEAMTFVSTSAEIAVSWRLNNSTTDRQLATSL